MNPLRKVFNSIFALDCSKSEKCAVNIMMLITLPNIPNWCFLICLL